MVVLLPRDFKQSKMKKYDESSDPVDYLRAFIDLMKLRVIPNAIMCMAFLSRWAKKTAIGLIQLTQDKDELLKDFIAQFNRATLRIKDLQMSAVVTAMTSRTRSHPFKMLLSKNSSNTMHELLKKENKYVDVEKIYFITKGIKDRKKPKSNKRKTRDEPEPQDNKGM
ncbi:Retrotransposon gag protein [Abeliophyllum distichum]|uniref:Retrotransposon gag protein n=1 Tax=Abeliophyllum distichum TaxID=126358 RepID=A0ABD1QXJ4_9LAMI